VHNNGATPEKRMVEDFGSGVAWIDYDGDGFPDVFFVNGAPGASNALYHNNKDGTFTDVTRPAGVAGISGANAKSFKTGVTVGDYDNDGRLDLFVTAYGPNILYKNNGNGTFTDVTAAAGLAGGALEWSTSTGFFDYDRDGDLDLYVATYSTTSSRQSVLRLSETRVPHVLQSVDLRRVADRLYRNNGNGTFTDVSKAAGIANPAGKGLGVTFCDYDRDGDEDVYVANDQVRNFLYRNNGDGTFKDVAYGAGVGLSPDGKARAGMGVDCADFDGNGFPDIIVTNFEDELNGLFKNLGDGTFQDVAATTGLQSSLLPLGFGAKFFDQDNDGDLDLFIVNGHVIDNVQLYRPTSSYAQRPLFYENIGGRFADITPVAGAALQLKRVGRGLAVADMDNDGDLDLAISNQGQAPQLLRNQAAGANWLELRAQGKKSNRFGLGARIEITAGGKRQVGEVNTAASYLSGNDVRLHFGLGAAKVIERITILWPSGQTQTLLNVNANQILTIEEP
jgi:hypothetical protein